MAYGMIYMLYDMTYDMIYDMIYDTTYGMIYDMTYGMIYVIYNIYDIYLLTAIGLTPGGSSTVHIYTQTVHRTTQSTQTIHRTTHFTN